MKTWGCHSIVYYSIYNLVINEIRTDFAYWQDKEVLKIAFEKHLVDVEKTTKNKSQEIWNDLYRIIETPLISLNKAEKQCVRDYFNSNTENVQIGWFDDLIDIADWKRGIKYIVEVKEFGFASAWYIVFRNNDTPLVIKHKNGYDNNTYFAMRGYRIRLGHKIYAMTEDNLRRLMINTR